MLKNITTMWICYHRKIVLTFNKRLLGSTGFLMISLLFISGNMLNSSSPISSTNARWSYSHAKGWIFGYKLHITSTTAGDLVVPITAVDVTTANVPDNPMYYFNIIIIYILFTICIVYVADPAGYDDKKLYEYSKEIRHRPHLSPIERYKSTFKKRLELVCFYESALGQQTTIYSRRISIEPSLIDREHIKSVVG